MAGSDPKTSLLTTEWAPSAPIRNLHEIGPAVVSTRNPSPSWETRVAVPCKNSASQRPFISDSIAGRSTTLPLTGMSIVTPPG